MCGANRVSQLRRIELRGPKSTAAICRALLPDQATPADLPPLHADSSPYGPAPRGVITNEGTDLRGWALALAALAGSDAGYSPWLGFWTEEGLVRVM
jgi:hypothetical protein